MNNIIMTRNMPSDETNTVKELKDKAIKRLMEQFVFKNSWKSINNRDIKVDDISEEELNNWIIDSVDMDEDGVVTVFVSAPYDDRISAKEIVYKIYQPKSKMLYSRPDDESSINFSDYNLVYEDKLSEFKGFETLENIFHIFNLNPPTDFTGYSLSINDIVVIEINGQPNAYICDAVGWTKLTGFIQPI